MAISKELEAKIAVLLQNGLKPQEIADREDVECSYQTILKLKKQVEKQTEEEKIKNVVELDPVTLHRVVEKAKEEAPNDHINSKLEKMGEGLTGLQLLDNKFHATTHKALKRAEEFLDSDDLTVAQWVSIMQAISQAYNNIFSSPTTQINVNNGTQISNSEVSKFKNALRS